MRDCRTQESWERPTRTYPDPATVKAALTGGDPLQTDAAEAALPLDDGKEIAGLLREALATKTEHRSRVVWADFPQTSPARPIPLQRCLTCGREDECCCPGCPTCPEPQMASGTVSAAWAQRMVQWGDLDSREGVV